MNKLNQHKKLLLLAAAVALLLAGVGGTVAYIVARTSPIVNTFQATKVTVEVQGDKSIKNTGDINAYIRAAVVATWQKEGIVHAASPQLVVNGTDWENKDGFYYYKNVVEPTGATSTLSVTTNGTNPTGYELVIEILAQGIQATGVTGATNYEDVWTNAANSGN